MLAVETSPWTTPLPCTAASARSTPHVKATDCSAVNRPSPSTSPSSRPSTQSSTTQTRPPPSDDLADGQHVGVVDLRQRRRRRPQAAEEGLVGGAGGVSSVTATAWPVAMCLAHDTAPVGPTAGPSARA